MHYDQGTLEQAIIHSSVAAMQAALLPTTFAQAQQQLNEVAKQLGAAQEQLKQCAEAITAKDANIAARIAEATALKTKLEAVVAHFGPDAQGVIDQASAPPETEPTPAPATEGAATA